MFIVTVETGTEYIVRNGRIKRIVNGQEIMNEMYWHHEYPEEGENWKYNVPIDGEIRTVTTGKVVSVLQVE